MQACWLLASAFLAALLASAGPIEAQSVKWRAVAVLEGGDSKNCGATRYDKFDVEINDGILTTRIANGTPYICRLQAPLNPDGSGKVIALNMANRPATFVFDTGTGARPIRVTPPFSVCVWTWRPVSSS